MKYQTISLLYFFGVKGTIYYVAIAMVIFSHMKITCYFFTWEDIKLGSPPLGGALSPQGSPPLGGALSSQALPPRASRESSPGI